MKNDKILVVSNMYPDEKHPSYGIFVKKFCDQLDLLNYKYSLSVMRKADGKVKKAINYLFFYFKTFFQVLFGNYRLIYVHYPSYSGAPVDFATSFRKRIIYTNLHGSDVVPENVTHEKMQRFTKNLLYKSKKIIVPSEYFKNLVSEKYGVSSTCISIYPSGGIDTTIFHEKDKTSIEAFKRKYGIDIDLPVFGMAGRVTKDKGWDTFVDAANGLDLKACFVIVGTGNEDKYLAEKIKESKGNVLWIKKLLPQDELATFYNFCDYFVFPTKRSGESLGLVAVEAMACGTPVISSDYAAPKYYVQDNVNGFKFAMGNAVSLAKVINKAFLLNNTEKANLRMGALNTSKQYYSSNLIEVFRKIFE